MKGKSHYRGNDGLYDGEHRYSALTGGESYIGGGGEQSGASYGGDVGGQGGFFGYGKK